MGGRLVRSAAAGGRLPASPLAGRCPPGVGDRRGGQRPGGSRRARHGGRRRGRGFARRGRTPGARADADAIAVRPLPSLMMTGAPLALLAVLGPRYGGELTVG